LRLRSGQYLVIIADKTDPFWAASCNSGVKNPFVTYEFLRLTEDILAADDFFPHPGATLPNWLPRA